MNFNGIQYFPFSVSDEKSLKLIESEFGLQGYAIYVKLLQEIYKFGYFLEINQDVILLLAGEYKTSDNLVSEIINACLRRELFDKKKYDEFKIITSIDIQENYLNATKRRTKVEFIKEYLLISVNKKLKNVYIYAKNVYRNAKNVYNSEQRRENKIKQEETKQEETKTREIKANDVGEFLSQQLNKTYTYNSIYSNNNYDLKKIINAVNNSDFLKLNANLDINWLLNNYAEIITGKYANYGKVITNNSFNNKINEVFNNE